jgi:hypothetical protein
MARWVLGFVLFLAACGAPTTHTIRYEAIGEVIGSAPGTWEAKDLLVSLTYTNAQGAIEQRIVRTPWTLDLTARSGRAVSIAVQNQRAAGRVTCRMLIDGQEAQKAMSDVAFGVASCGGAVP